MANLTYNVRIQKIETRYNRAGKATSFRVCWTVDRLLHRQGFPTRAQADGFRSELISAANRGEAFRADTGRPVSWSRSTETSTWFSFALAYAEVKWQQASPNYRRAIAEALTDATEVLLTRANGPTRDSLRAAMRWALSVRIRDGTSPPSDLAPLLRWLAANTVRMDSFSDRATAAKLIRAALTRLSQTQKGELAAANTANRKRMVLNNAMEYACEIGLLTENPIRFVKWTRPRALTAVDPRVVINSEQARRFLAAVERHSDRGARLKAFFGCMYYAGLRPEEAAELNATSLLDLPSEPGQWGEMRLTHAIPRSGSRWTESGKPRQRAALKHRARGDTRTVPIHPDLAAMLRHHLDAYGTGPDGRVFMGAHGGPVTDRTYLKVFHEARAAAFSVAEVASPLMDVPYSLRHAAVSTWLRTAGDPAQVARWAGHSVAVLLNVYAKCVHGAQSEALQRIWSATRE